MVKKRRSRSNASAQVFLSTRSCIMGDRQTDGRVTRDIIAVRHLSFQPTEENAGGRGVVVNSLPSHCHNGKEVTWVQIPAAARYGSSQIHFLPRATALFVLFFLFWPNSQQPLVTHTAGLCLFSYYIASNNKPAVVFAFWHCLVFALVGLTLF